MDKNQNTRKNDRARGTKVTPGTFDYEDEGVYYTPGNASAGEGKRPVSRRSEPSNQRPPSRSASAKPKKKPVKSQYIAFYLLTLVAAVVVCLVVFFLAFNKVTGDKKPSKTPVETGTPSPSETPITGDETSIVGMIQTINAASKSLGLMDIETQNTYTFTADGATALKNKYGEIMSFAEFKEGDIVDARYVEVGGTLASLTISSRAWEHKNVTNVKVNTEKSVVTLGNDAYTYDSEKTIIKYENNPYDVAKIEPLNVVTMRGMGANVWYIQINKGVGVIEVINGDGIQNGIIEIDNNLSMPLNEDGHLDEPIKVQTGTRRIVVKGSNIEPYVQELEVESGQTAILNLEGVQVTSGVLDLKINVATAKVVIDGKEIRASEPQILLYGEYTVEVTAEGYDDYKGTITIDMPTKIFDIVLKEKIIMRQITITSIPSGVDVYIDNAYVGISPITVQVEEGRRIISLKKQGFYDFSMPVDEQHNQYDIELTTIPPAVDTTPPYVENPTIPGATAAP